MNAASASHYLLASNGSSCFVYGPEDLAAMLEVYRSKGYEVVVFARMLPEVGA